MDVPVGPGHDEGRALLFQEGRGLQGALEVVADGHYGQIKIADAQGGDKGLVGAVADLGVGDKGQRVVHPLLAFVHGQHLVVQLPEFLGHVPPKAAQTDQ